MLEAIDQQILIDGFLDGPQFTPQDLKAGV
jgi:hypothetical protein